MVSGLLVQLAKRVSVGNSRVVWIVVTNGTRNVVCPPEPFKGSVQHIAARRIKMTTHPRW